MFVIMNLFILFVSILGLYYGSVFLIKGSVIIAERFNISKMAIAVTLVSAGTSMPEFFVSFIGGLKGSDNIAVGNIVGSNITNLLIILGVSGLISPIIISKTVLKRDYPIVVFVSILLFFMIGDGIISRIEGIILTIFFILYIYLYSKVFKSVDTTELAKIEDELKKVSPYKGFIEAIIGIILLYISSEALIYSSVNIAKIIGVSETVIGLSIVALGTSIPELFTSAIAAFKKEPEIALGNVIGSNFVNITMILGLTSLVKPLNVDSSIINRDIFIMIFIYLIPIIPIIKNRLGRFWSSILSIFYIVYILVIYGVFKIV